MRILSVLLLCFTINLHAKPFTVIVDPGHGGVDTGAARFGIQEADIALAVSKQLHRLIKKNGMNSLLTRTRDKKISLKQRALFANRNNGDLFVSIHANSSPHPRARGAEFYFQNQLPPSQEDLFLVHRENEVDQSSDLKEKLTSQFNSQIDSFQGNTDVITILEDLLRNKKILHSSEFAIKLSTVWKPGRRKKFPVRQAPFYLFGKVNMPSTLVELGYITHKKEARQLTKTSYQKKMARKILSGILEFRKSKNL